MRESHHRPFYVVSRDYKHFSKPKPLSVSEGETMIDLFPLLNAGRDVDDERDDASDDDEAGRGKHLLFFKAESNLCGPPYDAPLEWKFGSALHRNASCSLVLRVARANRATGPWRFDSSSRGSYFSDAISRPCVEGATAVRAPDGAWLLIFDNYRTDCLLLAPRDDGRKCMLLAGRPASAQNLRLSSGRQADADEGGACAYEPIRRGFGALRSTDLSTWIDITGEVGAPEDHKHGTALRLTPKAWEQVCEEPRGSPFERVCFNRKRSLQGQRQYRRI